MRYIHIKFIIILIIVLFNSAHSEESLTVGSKTLTAAMAQRVAIEALNTCSKLGYQAAAAVVGRNGNLIAFIRDPLSGPHTIDISEKKAFTSASTRVASGSLVDMQHLNFSDKLITIKGGLPISVAGYVYGGVGVSGATPEDDEVCAKAGIDAIKEDIEFQQ
ncbi:MAG: heme-binding protein [Gammaproteobacteria bacterium]